jgi:carboxymethylenebutenolidase
MLISQTFRDVSTQLDPKGRPIRIFIFSPIVPDYPHAKFPGAKAHFHAVIMAAAKLTLALDPHRRRLLQVHDLEDSSLDQIRLSNSEIYQVTGPVERFAGQIASHGYVVGERISCTLRIARSRQPRPHV